MDELDLINLKKQARVAAAIGDKSRAIQLYKQVLSHTPDDEGAIMELTPHPCTQTDHPRRATAAAATIGERDQPRGAGQGQRGREEVEKDQLDGADRADLQMARRRSRD